ncbi:hypothetical protein PI125_g23542 [Phytophthora idaei]|nr:hypothetical protein PI125_g23542 [Phytophthora idaei]
MGRAKNMSSSRRSSPCRVINAVRDLKLTGPAEFHLLPVPEVVSPGEIGGPGGRAREDPEDPGSDHGSCQDNTRSCWLSAIASSPRRWVDGGADSKETVVDKHKHMDGYNEQRQEPVGAAYAPTPTVKANER